MGCCQARACGTGRFFSRFAGRYRRRYQRQGLEGSQRQLVQGLQELGIAGASLLEVGCGVGYVHQELLRAGAERALGIDLSAAMLAQAQELAQMGGLAPQVEYRVGDFVDLAPTVSAYEVSILDKVVCCYPDAYTLVTAVAARTRRYCALTYPRDHLLNRAGIALLGIALTLFRNGFRPYFYEPERVADWFRGQGFVRVRATVTPMWLTEIYERG